MSAAVVPLFGAPRRPSLWPLFLFASVVLHGAGLLLASRAHEAGPSSLQRPSELVVVEVEPPRPHEEEPPPLTEPRLKPPKHHTVAPQKPAVPDAPPPNDTPPPDKGPPPPVVVGLTLESTTTAPSVAVPVGNTLVGKPAAAATAPSAVRPGFAPLYLVDTPPILLEEIKGEEIYPREAKKLGIEGTVVLAITVDADGRVSAARVLSGPGYGLNEAAQGAVLRARFKAATKDGKPVATDLRYSYTFVLN